MKAPLERIKELRKQNRHAESCKHCCKFFGLFSQIESTIDGHRATHEIFGYLIDSALKTGSLSVIAEISNNETVKAYMTEQQLNKILIYLLNIGQYDFGFKLIDAYSSLSKSSLLQRRVADLEKAKRGEQTYHRNMHAVANLSNSEFYEIDPDLDDKYKDNSGEVSLSHIEGAPSYWPDLVSTINSRITRLSDVVVMRDLTVVDTAKKAIHYESIKAVEASWMFTTERNNSTFSSFSESDMRCTLNDKEANNLEVIENAFLIPNATDGIGHFIHDALPCLSSYSQLRQDVAELPVIIKRNRPYDREVILEFVKTSFGSNIIELKDTPVKCKNLYIAGPIFIPRLRAYSKEGLLASKLMLDERYPNPGIESPQKIYISRGDGINNDMGARDVLNKDIIESGLLQELGYEIVNLSRMTHHEQVMLFKGTTHVAGIHGAGLMNIVFCKKNTKVIEILAEPWSYYTIAMFSTMLELNYVALSPSHLFSQNQLSEVGLASLTQALQ